MDGLLHTGNMAVSCSHHRGQGSDVLDAKVFKAVEICHMGMWIPTDTMTILWEKKEPCHEDLAKEVGDKEREQ